MPDNYLTNTEKPTVLHNNDPRGHAYTISKHRLLLHGMTTMKKKIFSVSLLRNG